MVREDPETAEELLSPTESLDSDDVRNADGDTVVDPPEGWSAGDRFGMTAEEQRQGESLDDRLSEEEPDVLDDLEAAESDDDDLEAVESDGDLLRDVDGDPVDGDRAHRGQVSGTPEDGDSIYPVVG